MSLAEFVPAPTPAEAPDSKPRSDLEKDLQSLTEFQHAPKSARPRRFARRYAGVLASSYPLCEYAQGFDVVTACANYSPRFIS